MTDVHFKIAFLLARESNGRMVQVSQRDSHVKHSRVTYNLGSSQCGTCQSGGSGFCQHQPEAFIVAGMGVHRCHLVQGRQPSVCHSA